MADEKDYKSFSGVNPSDIIMGGQAIKSPSKETADLLAKHRILIALKQDIKSAGEIMDNLPPDHPFHIKLGELRQILEVLIPVVEQQQVASMPSWMSKTPQDKARACRERGSVPSAAGISKTPGCETGREDGGRE